MYKRILVPIDGSATSLQGLREALKIARGEDIRVRILNVVDERMIAASNPVPLGGRADFIASMKASGQRALDEASELALRSRVEGECVQRESEERSVSDVILAEVHDWHADLLVMGTHGRRGLNRLLLGSDAERVLHDATVPVLLVKTPESEGLARRS